DTVEPKRFVVIGFLIDGIRSSDSIPNSVGIARAHMQHVATHRNVCIHGRLRGIRVEPNRVHSFEAVLKSDLLRGRQLYGIEMDYDMMSAWGQHEFPPWRLCISFNGYVFDID